MAIHHFRRISGNLVLGGGLEIAGNIVPAVDDVYYISEPSRKFRTIYVDQYMDCDFLRVNEMVRYLNIDSKNSAYTVSVGDHIILCDASGAAFTLTLPPVTGQNGAILIFKKIDASVNAITLDGDGGETIDGAATNAEMDTQYDTITLLCDGTQWLIIDKVIA